MSKNKKHNDHVEILEKTFKTWIKEGTFTLSEIIIGLKNACFQGTPMCENGNYLMGEIIKTKEFKGDTGDEYLGELHDGLEVALKAANKMEDC